jgi:integrase
MTRRGNSEGSIYQRADGRWAASIDLGYGNGRRRRKAFYGATRREVAEKLTAALRARQQGLPVVGERLTLAAFLARWLEDSARPTLRPRTFASYKMIVDYHLAPALGRVALARLTPDAVQRYLNDKGASGLSSRTLQYHHAVLRRALNQAERWGLVPRNVARLVSPPRVEHPEPQPLTPEQARAFLAAVSEDRLAALYALALGLGARQGELLGLTWADIDLADRTVSIRHTLQRYDGEWHLDPPKTERSRRTIALPASLVEMLRAHRSRQLEERLRAGAAWQGSAWGDLVFANEIGEPLSGSQLTRDFQAVLAALCLPRQRFHDLRHAAATFMLSEGVSLRTTMELLGHSTIAVTANTYSHVLPELQRDATERVSALLAQQ